MQKPVISVIKAGTLPLVPKKQDVVTAKASFSKLTGLLGCWSCELTLSLQVTKITPRLVSTDILCVGNRPLSDEKFTGIIR